MEEAKGGFTCYSCPKQTFLPSFDQSKPKAYTFFIVLISISFYILFRYSELATSDSLTNPQAPNQELGLSAVINVKKNDHLEYKAPCNVAQQCSTPTTPDAKMACSSRLFLSFLLSSLLISSPTHALPVTQKPLVELPLLHPPPKHATHGAHAAVASESDICTKIGIQLSEEGGNAADMVH